MKPFFVFIQDTFVLAMALRRLQMKWKKKFNNAQRKLPFH